MLTAGLDARLQVHPEGTSSRHIELHDSGYDFAGFVIIALVNLLLPTMVPKCAVL